MNICDRPYTSTDKWIVSFLGGFVFLFLSSPYFSTVFGDFVQTNLGLTMTERPSGHPSEGNPSYYNMGGLLVISLLFMVIIRLMLMKNRTNSPNNDTDEKFEKVCPEASSKDKWSMSMIGGLIFLLIASPFFYAITGKLFNFIGLNVNVKSHDGYAYPNLGGLVLHMFIFVLIIRGLMF